MTNAFHSMEDAFANFVTTGKFSFKDLVNSITADLARMSFKGAMASLLDSFKGSSIGQSLMGSLGGLFGQKQDTGGAVAGAASSVAGTASATAANTAMATLGTSAATSTAALTTMTASLTAQDVALATASASLGALAIAADAAAASMAASAAAGGGASGLGALAGLAGGDGGGGDAGMAAMLAGQFADGGDPPVGKVSLVGERGPELFVPKQAGTILPNDVFKNMGTGSGEQQQAAPVINIHNHYAEKPSRDTMNQTAAAQSLQFQRAMRANG
jgi:hypothetical protein